MILFRDAAPHSYAERSCVKDPAANGLPLPSRCQPSANVVLLLVVLLFNGNHILGMRAVLGSSAPVEGLVIIPRANQAVRSYACPSA